MAVLKHPRQSIQIDCRSLRASRRTSWNVPVPIECQSWTWRRQVKHYVKPGNITYNKWTLACRRPCSCHPGRTEFVRHGQGSSIRQLDSGLPTLRSRLLESCIHYSHTTMGCFLQISWKIKSNNNNAHQQQQQRTRKEEMAAFRLHCQFSSSCAQFMLRTSAFDERICKYCIFFDKSWRLTNMKTSCENYLEFVLSCSNRWQKNWGDRVAERHITAVSTSTHGDRCQLTNIEVLVANRSNLFRCFRCCCLRYAWRENR